MLHSCACSQNDGNTILTSTLAAPEHYEIEFERPDIRVVRIKNPTGHETPVHSPKAGVTVVLTDMNVAATSASGDVTEMKRSADDAATVRSKRSSSAKELKL